jgi:hypothetical protein
LKGPNITGEINEAGYIKESREKVATNVREVCMGFKIDVYIQQ